MIVPGNWGANAMAAATADKISDEEAAATEAARQTGEKSAARMSVHLDRIIHPTHAIRLAENDLARRQVARDGLHHGPGYCVFQLTLSVRHW